MLTFSTLALTEISPNSRIILQINTSHEYCRKKLSKTKHRHMPFNPEVYVCKEIRNALSLNGNRFLIAFEEVLYLFKRKTNRKKNHTKTTDK